MRYIINFAIMIFFLLVIGCDFAFAQGDAPPFVQGQATSKTVATVIQVPNSSGTKIGSKTLIETGNTNILVNPSFEHSTATTGWSMANGTAAVETSTVIDGQQSIKLTLTAQALEFAQFSTRYATQFADGVQGLAMMWVKTAVSGVFMCPMKATSTQTSDCVAIRSDNKWGLYKVPFVLGATNNGAVLASGTQTNGVVTYGNITGVIYVDSAFVGAVDLKIDGDSARLMGTVTITGCAAGNTTSSTSYASFGVQTGCVYTATGEASAPSTNIPAIKFSSLPAGDYKLEYEGTLYQSALAKEAFFQFWDGTNTAREHSAIYNGSNNIETSGISQSISYSATQTNVTLEIRGKTQSGGTANVFGTTVNPGVIRVWYFPKNSNSIYSSLSNGDTSRIGEVMWTSGTTAPNGFVSAANKIIGKASGDYQGSAYYALYENIWNLAGLSTTAGDPYKISTTKGASALLDWDAGKTITIDYYTNGVFVRQAYSGRTLGSFETEEVLSHTHPGVRVAITTGAGCAGAMTTGYVTNGCTGGAPTASSSTVASSGGVETRPDNVALNAWVRYEPTREFIIGKISGLESCASTLECTDTFTAKISTGNVISNENVDWLSTSSGTTARTINFNSSIFAVIPNCSCTVGSDAYGASSADNTCSVNTVSTSAITVNGTSNSVATSQPIILTCQKAGTDYVGKTAKAVASDQNVRTPGLTKAVSFGVTVGNTDGGVCSSSPCGTWNNKGSIVTGVVRNSTGNYTITMSGLNSAPVCGFFLRNFTGSTLTGCYATTKTSTTVSVLCQTTIANDAGFDLNCLGETP